MNAERLHAMAAALHKEMVDTQIGSQITGLCNSLQQMLQQNNQPQFQQNLASNRNRIYTSLSNCPSDQFSPAWKQLLSEMGGTPFFGLTLKNTIEGIFQRNQITPAVALGELQQLSQQVNAFQQALDQILAAFRQFKIGNEKLEPGECEIGILIPREAVDNSLNGFANELKDLIFVLNTFSEVATGKPDALSIKTISSSDLTVYLNAHSHYAAYLAVAVERIVALYKSILEIKKHRAELQKLGVPEKQIVGIEEHANKVMEDGIENLTVEFLGKHSQVKDLHRKNELGNAIRISLNRIANRIDKGFNIEVRVEPLEKAEAQSEEEKTKVEQIDTIQAASKNMQFIKTEGTPILKLPESTEKPKAKKE